MGSAGKRIPIRIVSRVTPRDVTPPLLPANARQGGEYGSLGICRARSEHGVTAPSGSAPAAASSPLPPGWPGRMTRRPADGPLGRVVAGPAASAGTPDAALPLATVPAPG